MISCRAALVKSLYDPVRSVTPGESNVCARKFATRLVSFRNRSHPATWAVSFPFVGGCLGTQGGGKQTSEKGIILQVYDWVASLIGNGGGLLLKRCGVRR